MKNYIVLLTLCCVDTGIILDPNTGEIINPDTDTVVREVLDEAMYDDMMEE